MLAAPPSTLKAAPLEPARVPVVPVQPVPPIAVSFTLLTPPVEQRLAKVPLRFPVVRFRAVTPEALTLAPIVSVPKFVVFVMPVQKLAMGESFDAAAPCPLLRGGVAGGLPPSATSLRLRTPLTSLSVVLSGTPMPAVKTGGSGTRRGYQNALSRPMTQRDFWPYTPCSPELAEWHQHVLKQLHN